MTLEPTIDQMLSNIDYAQPTHSELPIPSPSEHVNPSHLRPALKVASSHLVLITDVLATLPSEQIIGYPFYTEDLYQKQQYIDCLIRLKTDLVTAMNSYRIACIKSAPLDVQLMQEADLLWQCNLCEYHLSHRYKTQDQKTRSQKTPTDVNTDTLRQRSHWQIRRTIRAALYMKLLAYAKQLIPGLNFLSSISLREIWVGLKH